MNFSDSRMSLLNTLYQQMLANHLVSAMTQPPRFSPPPLRYPSTFNPFGIQRPAIGATATHGAGWEFGGNSGHIQNVGGNGGATALGGGVGAQNWFGPPPVPGPTGPPVAPPSGIGGPHYSPPAMRPPPGVGPLPGH